MARKKKLPPVVCRWCGTPFEPTSDGPDGDCTCPLYKYTPPSRRKRKEKKDDPQD